MNVRRYFGGVVLTLALALASRARAAEDVGYLGVGLENVPDALALHLGIKGGAIVLEVVPDSPAAKAGLRVHDVIQSVAGQEVRNRDQLREEIRFHKPGDKVKLSIRRGASVEEVEAALGSLAEAVKKAPVGGEGDPGAKLDLSPPVEKEETGKGEKEKPEKADKPKPGFLGIGFGDVPEPLAEHLGLAEGAGVIVNDVWPESPASNAKLAKSDVLLSVDGYEVKGPADFTRLIGEHKPGDSIKIEYLHRGQKASATVTLTERPKGAPPLSDEPNWVPGHDNFFRWHKGVPGAIRRKGRVIIEGPDGKSWKLDVPDTFWKAQEFSNEFQEHWKAIHKEIEKEMGKLQDYMEPEALKQRVKKLTEDLELEKILPDGDADVIVGPGDSKVVQSHSSVVRVVEKDLDITVMDNNGLRTVTVLKDGQKLQENLPWDQLDKLPADVRERVEKVAGGIKTSPPVKGKLPEGKIRA